jgi:ATP-dependent RNA circularization protein (DNA/RNA ligase family)
VNNAFYKFPSTPHLAILGENVVRGDKVMSEKERDQFLEYELVVEEKVDGANLGISFGPSYSLRAQNRGAYLHDPYSGQWKKLPEWLNSRAEALFEKLSDRYILFGEWCYAQHSVFYDRLPDWFLGFDIYDKANGKFLSFERRNTILRQLGIFAVPVISRGYFSLEEIKQLLSNSRFSDEPAEGVYLRLDNSDWLKKRAKLVRPKYVQALGEHWSRRVLKPNKLFLESRT